MKCGKVDSIPWFINSNRPNRAFSCKTSAASPPKHAVRPPLPQVGSKEEQVPSKGLIEASQKEQKKRTAKTTTTEGKESIQAIQP
jgi:hypothetical protein